jgi:transcriptional regulator with GAF, ATPase, and Fis domain
MDKNEFFRQATLKICGHLEIELGLQACLEHISRHMPADSLYLERYDSNLNAMRPIARATSTKAEVLDMLIPLPKNAKAAMNGVRKSFFGGSLPPVIVINESDKDPVIRNLLEKLGEPSSSAMSLPLFSENQVAGTLILLAGGRNRFEKHHADLFATLKIPFFVALSNTLKHREILNLKELLADDNRYLQGELRRLSGEEVIGADFGLKEVVYKVQQVAPLNSPVLLLGETGVGKDVIANSIHYSSARKNGPFVSVNCGAIPETLIDSELFGHEKGAFTGALFQKRGRFERADKGTIFLDEIGELPLQAQVRLLKVLQSREIERVGGIKTIKLDIRIIAATNRNLEEMIKLGQFREDLWFRINVFPIWIPPLRERSVDIPALLQHFIRLKCKELKLPVVPPLASGAIDTIMEYRWPGNVRELENVIERALILNPKGPLTFDHLDMGKSRKTLDPRRENRASDNLDNAMSNHILRILSKANGKVNGPDGAASLLGINPSTLRHRMKKLGIEYGRDDKH